MVRISVMLDSASTGLMKIQSQQRRQFRVYVRRAPSRKFETLSISCERNIADGRRCQSHRGEVQIVQAVQSLRSTPRGAVQAAQALGSDQRNFLISQLKVS